MRRKSHEPGLPQDRNVKRFDDANALWDSGRIEEAIREFHAMAMESHDVNEKCGLMLNEVRCYADLGRLADSERVLGQIRQLVPDDSDVCFGVDFGAACVTAQGGNHDNAVLQYERILKEYACLLEAPEYRYYYEEIQRRKGLCLAFLGRYSEAIPVLREASSFSGLVPAIGQEVNLYLGICYAELHENNLAKEQFLHAIEFGLKNGVEAEARYRAAILYFAEGGFAQTKYQLESIVRTSREEIRNVPRKYIYVLLSRACWHLGEEENAKRYAKLAEYPGSDEPNFREG